MTNCGNCFFSRANDDNTVACRRYPPHITRADGTTVTSTFPLLHTLMWCGEHRHKGWWRRLWSRRRT